MLDRHFENWLPTYVAEFAHRRRMRRVRQQQTTHLLFMICDHFEPRHGAGSLEQSHERMRSWASGYREMQDEIHASHGLRPLHSWFYPPHHGPEFLSGLAEMAFTGLGEVELHYHHSGDTEETLRKALQETLAEFRRWGLLQQSGDPPVRRFGFIHGDWALDNSDNGANCGVNSELTLLHELGCWADLTLPSANRCQTRKINSIYYAIDDPHRPKSHNWGQDACMGQGRQNGLLLMQGPLAINWRAPRYPRIENASVTTENWGRPDRIDQWIDCHVHVRGRPEWLFIKLHTHGAVERDFDALFGTRARQMHRLLAEKFNDGKRFKLHYVTARQAYNITRAAEQGHGGDPAQYLDFEIPPQVTSRYFLSSTHQLAACTDERLVVEAIDGNGDTVLRTHYPGLKSVSGALGRIELDARRQSLSLEPKHAGAELSIALGPRVRLDSLDGAQIVPGTDQSLITLKCAARATLRYQVGL